jgi:hypothetical protein
LTIPALVQQDTVFFTGKPRRTKGRKQNPRFGEDVSPLQADELSYLGLAQFRLGDDNPGNCAAAGQSARYGLAFSSDPKLDSFSSLSIATNRRRDSALVTLMCQSLRTIPLDQILFSFLNH